MWLYFPISLPQFYPHVPPQILSFHERLQFVGPQLGTVIFLILECQTSPNLQQVELLHLLWAHRGCRTETAVKTLNLKICAGREVLWEPADSIAQRFITNTQVITLAQEECVNYIFNNPTCLPQTEFNIFKFHVCSLSPLTGSYSVPLTSAP